MTTVNKNNYHNNELQNYRQLKYYKNITFSVWLYLNYKKKT